MPESRNLSGCQVFSGGNLPVSWRCQPLGERLVFAYGRSLRAEDRKTGDVDVYGSNGKVGQHNVALVASAGVLVGRKGSIGAVHYAPRAFWPIDTVYYVVPSGDDDPRFVFHLLSYLPLGSLNAATGVPGLSRRDVYALRGVFPQPREQAAIAQSLDAVDTALERTRVAVERAREAKRALLQRLLSYGVRNERRRKSVIGFIPQAWDVVAVDTVVTGFQYGLSVPMQLNGTMPILRMGNVQAGGIVFNDVKYVSLPEKVVSPYRVRRGDVLFNRTNSQELVGKIGVYRDDREAVFASYLIRLFPDPKRMDGYFLGHVLNSYPAQCRIKRYATPGVQQVNINAKNLGKVLIPLPGGPTGLGEQQEIVAILEEADAVVRKYEPVLHAQAELKRSLMHDLLTGRVRVGAYEREGSHAS
ncbi:MAG: restriction endonuclease subunit S [Kiritimatiellae bacterium]|nr:restriction endonuclease subunit S [Kiritimatiellia bacterium]